MGRPFIIRPPAMLSQPGVMLAPLIDGVSAPVSASSGGGGGGEPTLPGLLMHFDGTWDDEIRGRTFVEAGGIGFNPAGQFGQAMQFANSDSVTTTEHLEDFEFDGAGTVEFFVKPAIGNVDVVAFLDDSNKLIWSVRIGWGEGYFLPSVLHYGPGGWNNGAMTAIPTGVFSHVAFVFDAGAIRIYIGGTMVANLAGRPSLWSAQNITGGTAGSLVVGSSAVNGEYVLDELRILPEVIYTGASFTPPAAPFSAAPVVD